jgi:hypothetical protein
MKVMNLVLMGVLAAGAAGEADAAQRYPRAYGYQNYTDRQVNNMITRAYREILGRNPDPVGFAGYRREILYRGLTEQGMRQAMLDSPEYRRNLRGSRNGRYGWRYR